jgi:hypothetical protein
MLDTPIYQTLKDLCLFLDQNQMEYVLVGGIAVGIWSEPRATVDIDFLISMKADDFPRLKEKLDRSGKFVFVHEKPVSFEKITFLRATLKSNTDISVDFLFADDDLQRETLKRKEPVSIGDISVNIITPEDLILLKLLSGRPQDKLDAAKIIKSQGENLDREHLNKWSRNLGLDLKGVFPNI